MSQLFATLPSTHKLLLLVAGFLLCTQFTFAQDKTAASAYNEGLGLLKEKKYEEGLPLLEEALKLAEAEENEQVVGLAKKNGAVAAYNVGNNKRKAGEMEEAQTYYEKGIELNPEYASNYTGLAVCVEKAKGDDAATVGAYLKAAEMNSSKPQRMEQMQKKAQNVVGRLYTGKEYDKAVDAGNLYLEMVPDNAEVNYYLARSLVEKGEHETALVHADKAIDLAGDDAKSKNKYYMAKGSSLEGLERNADAVATYKMVTAGKYLENAKYLIEKLGS